MESSLSFKVLI